MKASELIEQLKRDIELYGDVPVVHWTHNGGMDDIEEVSFTEYKQTEYKQTERYTYGTLASSSKGPVIQLY